MELIYDIFPDFYKSYEWLPEEEENPDNFTGREYYLKNFWRDLCNMAGKGRFSRQNRAFIGQRKLGKTSFLIRCYNVAFWEQDQVIPFYYCFPQKDKVNLRDIANEIAFKLLKQALVFVTKDREILEEKKEEVLFLLLKEKDFSLLKKLIMYWNITKKQLETCKESLILEKVWELVDIFSGLFRKKCMIVIDEYQKTVQDLLDENGNPVPCHESIAKIVNIKSILTMISGSQISMLAHRAVTSQLNNRMPKETFSPLLKEDAYELILRYVGNTGYKNIEQDVYKLVGGNPYYIKMLFTPTNKFYEHHNHHKKWGCLEDIKESYNFEMLHLDGEVFQFWEEHLDEKHHLLNGDPEKHKGVTLRILKFIAEKEANTTLDELREKFPVFAKGEMIREKMRQLRKADLIRDSEQSQEVYNFSDMVLPVVITKMHQKEVLGNTSPEAFERDKQRWWNECERRLNKVEKNVNDLEKAHRKTKSNQKKIKEKLNRAEKYSEAIKVDMEKYFIKLDKLAASALGKANLEKGTKGESEFQKNLKKCIDKKQGMFARYKLVGSLQDINVSIVGGGGGQIDLFGQFTSLNGTQPKECIVIGEMKNWKNKVGTKEIQKFLNKVSLVKIKYKLENVVCIYVATSGFYKPAEKLLKKNNIFYGNSYDVVEQIK